MKRAVSVIKEYIKTSDMLLLCLCICSSIYGLFLIYSATRTYETNEYMHVQIIAIIIGIFLFIVMSLIDIELIAEKWIFLLLFNILFISTLFIWGVEGGTGNKSWLRFFNIGIQPAEVVKVSFAVLLSKQLAVLKESRQGINSVPSVLMLVLHFGFMFMLIIVSSRDLGSALVFAVIFIAVLFAAGIKAIWFFLGTIVVAAMSPLIWNNLLSDYQKARILAPYFPETVDPSGLGVTWQANQSKIMLASGQLTGQGYLKGTQTQSSMMPFKHTDFIFAVAGEELGMIGCCVIILLLVAIILRCLYVGVKSKSYMSMMVCSGVAAMLIFQTFENIGMCIGITPVVGITLPFFSYGGSSVMTTFAALGIVSGIRMRPNTVAHRQLR
ncbi:MAG: FtsW/RodA/SpoVE family cell cycle protein [Clostridiales bacterium]|nr:FtsW/RodA/SpoVE family cell cycle protein [Clostridiales bacterium]